MVTRPRPTGVNGYLTWIIERLRERDPGLLRFEQAIKSVIAVVVALELFRHAGEIDRLFAAISAAFIMQCVDAGPKRRQYWSMLITGGAMTALGAAGTALQPYTVAKDLLLIAVAFGAFYARRFLIQGGFALFGFTLTLLSTALPGSVLMRSVAIGTGLAIAFPIRFFVLRPNEQRALADGAEAFERRACFFLASIRRCALCEPLGTAQREVDDTFTRLRASLLFNQHLLEQAAELVATDQQRSLLRMEYEKLHVLRMMGETAAVPRLTFDVSCRRVRRAVRELSLKRLAATRRVAKPNFRGHREA